MFARVGSCGLEGLDGFIVDIEVDVSTGTIPSFDIVGLPDASVREARDRVRSALKNSGFHFQPRKVTVNLAPGDKKKEGPLYDLPIAVGLISAYSEELITNLGQYVLFGELALDGSIRPIKGVLPLTIASVRAGCKKIILPMQNASEARLVDDAEVFPAESLRDVADFLYGKKELSYDDSIPESKDVAANDVADYIDVYGQEQAKRAIEIAAAGFHNLIMIGPPGSGKTMLARRIPSVLPPLSRPEILEITKIYSIAGLLDRSSLITERPFRSPHHSASSAGIVGGGTLPRPGEVSLAHNGVLFLDELPEFKRDVLEILRQPLEDAKVTISRASGSLTYPADVMLIAACNPCPCGFLGDRERQCSCTPLMIQRYRQKFSGPILDRIDLHLSVPRIGYDELNVRKSGLSSSDIRTNVIRALEVQQERYKKEKYNNNGRLSSSGIRKYCALDKDGRQLLKVAFDKLKLSVRAHDRILKVARTIADLEGSENITSGHLSEAIGYRSLDRENIFAGG